MDILITFLTVVHFLIALLLIPLVLMQKSREQGVGAAFGGGFADTMLGGSVTPLVKLTIYCAVGLLVTTVALGLLHSHRGGGRSIMKPGTAAPAMTVPVTGETNVPVETIPPTTTNPPSATTTSPSATQPTEAPPSGN
jgi:preprotein translocase subunit SecG